MIPISTATNTPGKPIKIQSTNAIEILMNPDGKTVYAIGQSQTGDRGHSDLDRHEHTRETGQRRRGRGRPGHHAGVGRASTSFDYGIRPGPSGVIPFSTATNTAGKLIKVDGMASAIAVTPDGNTAYVASEPSQKPAVTCTGQTGVVTPISTATNRPGRPIRVACDPYAVAVTPDGKTVWVGSRNWVTPISTATNTAGKPIKFRGALVAMVVAVSP